MASTETETTANDAQAEAARWIGELELSERFQKKWVTRARKINRRYEADRSTDDTKRRFSMLWSNTQTIAPAVYARPPQPVVSRRFKDADPVGRLASEVLERSLSFAIDKQDLDGVLRLCALDYTLNTSPFFAGQGRRHAALATPARGLILPAGFKGRAH